MKKVVFYHAQCLDGLAGAWAAWKKFGSAAEYRGLKHEDEHVPNHISGRDVFFIDFCLSRTQMRHVKDNARSLTIIDHHISHRDVIPLADRHSFNLKKSGCVLSWEYFHPNRSIPELFLTIQDIDLFTLKRRFTREYAAMLMLHDFEFESWGRLVRRFQSKNERKRFAEIGSTLLAYKEKYVDRLMGIAQPVRFHGIKAYAVNTDVFYSEAGTRIYSTLGVHLGITWYYKDGKIKVSLRSDGTVDAARIAAKYGGGGHIGAAGFWIDFSDAFPWSVIK